MRHKPLFPLIIRRWFATGCLTGSILAAAGLATAPAAQAQTVDLPAPPTTSPAAKPEAKTARKAKAGPAKAETNAGIAAEAAKTTDETGTAVIALPPPRPADISATTELAQAVPSEPTPARAQMPYLATPQPVDSPVPLVKMKTAKRKTRLEPIPESLLQIELASFPLPPQRPQFNDINAGSASIAANAQTDPDFTATGSITVHSYAPVTKGNNAGQTFKPLASADIEALIIRNAGIYKIPESLLRRVVARESGGNPRARNGPYLGLMQMRLETARGMGYRGDAGGLLDAGININYGAAYLANAYRVAGGNHDNAVRLYASGYYYEAKRKGVLDRLIKRAEPHK